MKIEIVYGSIEENDFILNPEMNLHLQLSE